MFLVSRIKKLQTVLQSVLLLCVAAYWPKQMHLTASHGRLTEHIFSFSAKPCLLTQYSCTHLSGSCPVKPFFFSFLAPLKQFGQRNRGDQEHQNSRWECFTHSVPPQMRSFSSCVWRLRTETSDLQSTFSLLRSLGFRRFLPRIWQWWYCLNVSPDLRIVNSFSSFFSPFPCLSFSLFLFLTQSSPGFTGRLPD